MSDINYVSPEMCIKDEDGDITMIDVSDYCDLYY